MAKGKAEYRGRNQFTESLISCAKVAGTTAEGFMEGKQCGSYMF